ncbi:MAG: S9 family peptidase, partial [Flavobacteriaceae bacterium]|nr:S9 family peptidase [Flavobacteriaceae bacterium]
MYKLYWSLLFFIGTLSFTSAQQQQLTLEEIWNGTFKTEGLIVLHSMQDGKHYTVLNRDHYARTVSVDKYNYLTQEKTATLVSTKMLPELNEFSRYTFSKDEQKLLLATAVEPIYRRSRRGIYYSFDRSSAKAVKIADTMIQEPGYSPDGSKVAYVFENNLYIHDLDNNSTRQITEDGKTNAIINGITDWVYEEEFSFVKAYAWNSDGSKIAFLSFDETEVPEFSMDVYGTALYPQQH